MVSDVTIGGVLSQAQKTDIAQGKLAEDFSQFLTLLTVQLQNQDPLSPMDTTEFTNQLVAFTGVEQQINTNQKLDSMIALSLGNAFSSSQNYVGKEVSYISSEFEYTGEQSKLRYSLSNPAAFATIYVYNEFGEVVYSEQAETSAGAHEFVWDGSTKNGSVATPGTYEIRVDALDENERAINTSTVVTGKVRGVESQNGQIFLLIGERAVPLSNILNTSQASNSSASDALTAALSYVGLNISYLNTEINYDGSQPEDVIYELASDAERAKILIFDENGQMVYTADVDPDKGRNLFRWDGRLSDGSMAESGTYQFVIDAIDADDRRISASSISEGVVSGVESKNGRIFLNVGQSSISLDNILSANVADDEA